MINLRPAATIGLLANGRDQQTLTHYGIILWILVAYPNPKYEVHYSHRQYSAVSMFMIIDLKLSQP